MKSTRFVIALLSLIFIMSADGHIEADDVPPSVNKSLKQLVSVNIPRVRFQDDSLEDCLKFLSTRFNFDGHFQMELKWKIDKNALGKSIRYEANDVKLEEVLEHILQGIPHALIISREGVFIQQEENNREANKPDMATPRKLPD